MKPPDRITSRIALVTLQVKAPTLLARSRKVFVEIHGKRSETVELSVNRQEEIVRLSWLEFDEFPPREVTIRLFDGDNLQVLHEETVGVELVV